MNKINGTYLGVLKLLGILLERKNMKGFLSRLFDDKDHFIVAKEDTDFGLPKEVDPDERAKHIARLREIVANFEEDEAAATASELVAKYPDIVIDCVKEGHMVLVNKLNKISSIGKENVNE